MVQRNDLLGAAKDIGVYVLITVGTYMGAIVAHLVIGFFEEKVLPQLGLNASGTAYTAIESLASTAHTSITAIAGIVTVITGLLTLNVVLRAFGFSFSFSKGA